MKAVITCTLLFFCLYNTVCASPWQDIAKPTDIYAARAAETDSFLHSYRALRLNEAQLRQQLTQFSLQQQAKGLAQAALQLPLPDGNFARVLVKPTQTLAPALAARYPELVTWEVHSLDGQISGGSLDFTPQGFHALLDMPDGDTVFIDPQDAAGQRFYASFSRQQNANYFRDKPACAAHTPSGFAPQAFKHLAARQTQNTNSHLYTYRIAIAATAEYTQKQGGRAIDGLSAIVTTLNRINYIYKRDLSVRLQLVSDERLVYTDPDTDPFSNARIGDMLQENQVILNAVLGEQGYDIGHVFGTTGGGRSYVGVACSDRYKARGATGLSSPAGDTFDISYVAHEIGHQLGATHTFNGQSGSCRGSNRDAQTAFEPGSGSTIMSYAGICADDNLQTEADPMFHAASIAQVKYYVQQGMGMRCAQIEAHPNRKPSVDAGKDYSIPANTPFTLSGSASDADGDTLSYSWEQMDAGTASAVDIDSGDNAIIRAYPPSPQAQRSVPRLSDLLSPAQAIGERLPSQTRALNFRLTVRDGKATAYDDKRLNVVQTGQAFAVTAPTSTQLAADSALTVEWQVAATDQVPISCQQVDIAVTSDQGESFTTLARQQANNGQASVNLPAYLGETSHIRVKCSNNIFFALSAMAAQENTDTGASTSNNDGNTNTANLNNGNVDAEPASNTASQGGGGSSGIGLLLGLLLCLVGRFTTPLNHPKHQSIQR